MVVKDRGGVDSQPANVRAAPGQLEAVDGALAVEPLDESGQFLRAEGGERGLAAHIAGQGEEALERRVGELDAPGVVEDQHAFGHAVEERLGLPVRRTFAPARRVSFHACTKR